MHDSSILYDYHLPRDPRYSTITVTSTIPPPPPKRNRRPTVHGEVASAQADRMLFVLLTTGLEQVSSPSRKVNMAARLSSEEIFLQTPSGDIRTAARDVSGRRRAGEVAGASIRSCGGQTRMIVCSLTLNNLLLLVSRQRHSTPTGFYFLLPRQCLKAHFAQPNILHTG